MDHEPEPDEVPGGSGDAGPGEVSELPLLPGFREMALRRMSAERRRFVADLTAQRRSAGLSQTEVAARMGTSQSAVARLETGDADVRVSTLERYAAAIGSQVAWLAGPGQGQPGQDQPADRQPGYDQPGHDQPGHDQPGQDQPGLERADRGHPGQAQPHLMQPGSKQPGSAQAQPQAELGQEYR